MEACETTYDTRFGRGLLAWRDGMLVEHRLPSAGRRARPPQRGADHYGPHTILAARLESYFSGRPADFAGLDLPLMHAGWTDFQEAVAAALLAVPYGATVSYGGLAAAAGYPRAGRAVGSFMARNPWPVIFPCHRVVRSSGALGNFSSGTAWKKRLLGLEGITIRPT